MGISSQRLLFISEDWNYVQKTRDFSQSLGISEAIRQQTWGFGEAVLVRENIEEE